MNYVIPEKDVAWRRIGDEVLVLHLRTGVYYSLNMTGAVIWETLASGADETEIITALATAFTGADRQQLQADCRELTAELSAEGLLVQA